MKIYNDELLEDKRTAGDPAADLFISEVFADNERKVQLFRELNELRYNCQLAEFVKLFPGNPVIPDALVLPAWANKKQLTAGAAFFAKHAQVIINMLGLLSLPYCYAGANGAMVLYLSDRMRGDIGKRLIETGEYVWDVMAPNAFESDGKGFASILKVRLIHAAVRFYTLKNPAWNKSFGYPVNQEDMAGTNLSFSLIVIRGLRKFGFTVSYDEQQAFMHLWNIIGALGGLNRDLLPGDGKQAFQLEEAIRLRQFNPSVQGQELTTSLVNYFKSVNKNGQFLNSEIPQVIRYLTGDEVADILELPKKALPGRKVRLLRTINFLKPLGNIRFDYQQELQNFRRTKGSLLQQ